jgi:hypothetical protein
MDFEAWGQYGNRVLGALFGKSEGFYNYYTYRDVCGNLVKADFNIDVGLLGFLVVLFYFVNIIIIILGLFGAAKLSWCYNTFYGMSEGEKAIWAVLCFFFAGFYYPFYALLLDPVCGRVAQRGGKKN